MRVLCRVHLFERAFVSDLVDLSRSFVQNEMIDIEIYINQKEIKWWY